MSELATNWNGLTRGDVITLDGEQVKFIHAKLYDGVVQYVMVVDATKSWRAVPAETVSATTKRRK